jgi:hypothetical protein
MKLLLYLMIGVFTLAAQPTTTQIADTAFSAAPGAPLFTGRVVIILSASGTAAGRPVLSVPQTVSITSGALSVALVPNSTITPANTYYLFSFSNGLKSYCTIPVSATPIQLAGNCTATVSSTALTPQIPFAWLNLAGYTDGYYCTHVVNGIGTLSSSSCPGTGTGSGTFTALSGDATSTATGGATTVSKINGITAPAALPNTCVSSGNSHIIYTCIAAQVITTCSTGMVLLWTPDVTNSSASALTLDAGCGTKNLLTNEKGHPTVGMVVGGASNLIYYDGTEWLLPPVVATLTGSQVSGAMTPASAGSISASTVSGFTAGAGTLTGPASGLTIGTAAALAAPTGAIVGAGQANTFTTGLQDFSAATGFKMPTGAGLTATATMMLGYDSTAGLPHIWYSAADHVFGTAAFSATSAFQAALTNYSTISGLSGYPSFTSAATTSIGTSGATLPLLSTANTWTLAQTFSTAPVFSNGAGTLECLHRSTTGIVTGTGSDCGSGGGGGAYSQSFTTQTSVTVAHNLGTTAVVTQCFDNSSPPVNIEWNKLTITDTNNVTVTFLVAQSGSCVVTSGSGSGGGGGGTIYTGTGIAGAGTLISPLTVDLTAVPTRLSNTATLTFTSIAQSACNEQTISLTGATTGDEVILGAPAAVEQGFVWSGYVSSASTVTVRMCKITSGTVTPAALAWRATIVRSF